YKNGKFYAYIVKEENTYTLYSNPNEENGMKATSLGTAYLEQYNTALGNQYLVEQGMDLDKVYNNIEIKTEEIKGDSSMVNYVLYMGFVFAMMSICLTAIYGVTDTTAGEKERGTLETLLTFPMKSDELVKGKFYAITISCIITSIISTALLVGSIGVARGMFEIYKDVTINLNVGNILLVLLIMFNISFFISGLCIAIASFSKTYKEAQSALTPVNFITMIPMFFNILDIKLNYGISFLPIVSHTMLLDCAINNNLNIGYFLISFISTIIYSFIVVQVITKMYKSERVLFAN
ncbi:MAG: ABC transporter permease, partial [Bacilli bacterium]|nr:ABC transporter permease [Bacilli bacterium]